jgi:hypothetical protein
LITNNPFIFDSSFYTKSDALLFPLNGDKNQLLINYNKLKTEPFSIRKRSITDFIENIISVV